MHGQPENLTTSAGPAPRVERERPRVLVVNDTQEILELFREILEEEGFDVELASYGFDDVGVVERADPDLVILDFIINGEEVGWQMLQKLKMSRSTMHLPVIVCTGAVRLAQDLQGHLTEKDVGLVLKPFDIDDLLREVHRVIRREASAARTSE